MKRAIGLVMALALAACTSESDAEHAAAAGGEPETAAAGATSAEDARLAIDSVLALLQSEWNADDLAGHVGAYAESGTYTTSRGLLTGRAAIEEAMAGFVTPDGLAGELSFEDVLVRMLGADAALATGAFIVADVRDTVDIRGRFTLVLERGAAGWQVLHDHSS